MTYQIHLDSIRPSLSQISTNEKSRGWRARAQQGDYSRFYEAANQHNVDLAAEVVAPDFIDDTNKIEGLESLKQFGNMFIRGIPDLHWTIEDIALFMEKVE